MKTILLICGASGSGKSWVCNQLKDDITYVPYDKMSLEEAFKTIDESKEEIFLYDPTTMISTFISRNKDKYKIIPIFIIPDFITLKSQLIKRKGRITKSLYRRYKRMISLNKKHGVFRGDSNEVLKYVRNTYLKDFIIYRALSDNNKVYIGKTSHTLEERIKEHEYYAKTNKGNYFHNALNIHSFKWEELTKVKGNALANKIEKALIKKYNSSNKDKGYNLTEGGDGVIPNQETKDKISESVTEANIKRFKDPIKKKDK